MATEKMTLEAAKQIIIKHLPDDFLKDEKNREALSLMGTAFEQFRVLTDENLRLIQENEKQQAEIERLKKSPTLNELAHEGTKEYLVKVRYTLSRLRVYRIKTDNIYRIVGKFYCTSIEHIERIDYSIYTPEREKFWADEGYKINGYTEPLLSEEMVGEDNA